MNQQQVEKVIEKDRNARYKKKENMVFFSQNVTINLISCIFLD